MGDRERRVKTFAALFFSSFRNVTSDTHKPVPLVLLLREVPGSSGEMTERRSWLGELAVECKSLTGKSCGPALALFQHEQGGKVNRAQTGRVAVYNI